MNRKKNLVLVSHCLLNQNSVVIPLARAKGAYNSLLSVLMDYNLGIIQLPCPEILHLGMSRKPLSKEAYDTDAYRQLCQSLLQPILCQLEYYIEENYNLIGLIGIDQSPTCSLDNKGILMEILFDMLGKNHIEIRHIAVPTNYEEEKDTSFVHVLEHWIQDGIS
jgi:predicted secreted protein